MPHNSVSLDACAHLRVACINAFASVNRPLSLRDPAHDRSLLAHGRSLLAYDRSLLAYDRSLLAYDRSR